MIKKFKTKSFYILSFASIIILSVLFVFQINIIASETRLINTYTERLEVVNQENELLTVNSAKKNSLSNVINLIESFGFERVEKVHYIHERGEVVKERFISSP